MKLGTSGRVLGRKELKPARKLSDQELLADALKEAEKWVANKRKGMLHSN